MTRTLAEYIELFRVYYGLLPDECAEVKRAALRDREAAKECFAALAREIESDPRHGVNERLYE